MRDKMIRPTARFGINFLRYGQSLGLNRLMPPSKMNVSRLTYAETYILIKSVSWRRSSPLASLEKKAIIKRKTA